MALVICKLNTLIPLWFSVMVLQVLGEEASCFDALGMEDGTIKDSQITVSSVYRETISGASARLRLNLSSWGAWCPNRTHTDEDKIKYDEYIQIDLLDLTTIRKVATQGREYSFGSEHVETYQISYSRDGKIWLYYKRKNSSETKIFIGNTDEKTVIENKIDPPIIARYIRIHPGYSKRKYVCVRLELYGRTWNEQGILSYTIPEGQVTKNGRIKYKDTNYTGTKTGGMLHGGTGLLTDGEIGPVDSKRDGGEGWVGWKQAEQHGVNITFEFDCLRLFSNVTITVNVAKQRSLLFNKTQIFISKRKDDFSLSSALQYLPEQVRSEATMEILNVTLTLCGTVGKFVWIQLYPEGQWLLISEIKFHSVPVFDKTTFQTCFDGEHDPCFCNRTNSNSPPLNTPSPVTTLSYTDSSESSLLYILIALGCGFCLIGLVIVVLLCRIRSQLSKRNRDVSLEIRTPSLNNDNYDVPEAPAISNQPPYNNEQIKAESDVEQFYEYPYNYVTPHQEAQYTSLMKRTEEEGHAYQKLGKPSIKT